MIQHINSLASPPIIGQTYFVDCVMWRRSSFSTSYLTPTIGPVHEDAEIIGVPGAHLHIDFRFVGKRLWDRLSRSGKWPSVVFGNAAFIAFTESKTFTRAIKCKREWPDFPTHLEWTSGLPIEWLSRLEDAFADKKLKPDCAACPHRGIPLKNTPVRDGVVVCPGHGLMWNVNTRAMVRREAVRQFPATPAQEAR